MGQKKCSVFSARVYTEDLCDIRVQGLRWGPGRVGRGLSYTGMYDTLVYGCGRCMSVHLCVSKEIS
jgi:hypothetical protein